MSHQNKVVDVPFWNEIVIFKIYKPNFTVLYNECKVQFGIHDLTNYVDFDFNMTMFTFSILGNMDEALSVYRTLTQHRIGQICIFISRNMIMVSFTHFII